MKIIDVLHSPWAILPDRLLEMQAIYSAHLRGPKIDLEAIEAKLGKPLQKDEQGYSVQDGVAIVPLQGAISKRMNMMARICGGASAELFVNDMQAAMDDPAVKAIIIHVDSPGGTVDGTQVAADAVRNMRGQGKQIVTFCDGMMASAAYWIGSAADKVYIDSQTAQVGSIGVVSTHVDVSRAEAANGRKTTEIFAGKYKRIASNYAPLSAEGKASIQDQVDYLYSVFVGDVAKNRNVSVETVLSDMADGRIFVGQQAIDAGLVDGVSTLSALIADLSKSNSASAGGADPGAFPFYTGANAMTLSEVIAGLAATQPEAVAALRAEGATAERERIKAVREQSMPGHEALIEALAFDGKTTGAEAAMQVLAAEKSRLKGVESARASDAPAPVKSDDSATPDGSAAAEPAAVKSYAAGERNYAVDPNSAQLDAKAKAYMSANPGTDYLSAVRAVQKGA